LHKIDCQRIHKPVSHRRCVTLQLSNSEIQRGELEENSWRSRIR